MDGAAASAGVGGTIVINGRRYSIRARTVEFYALVEAEIVKLRGNPLDLIVQSAQQLKGEEDATKLIDTIAQVISNRFRNWRLTTWADYGCFYDTPFGTAFQLWCCINHNQNCPSVDEILLWLWKEVEKTGDLSPRDMINAAIDRAGSEDALGNSTGPSQPTQTTGQA